jgi:hypothetical protein
LHSRCSHSTWRAAFFQRRLKPPLDSLPCAATAGSTGPARGPARSAANAEAQPGSYLMDGPNAPPSFVSCVGMSH